MSTCVTLKITRGPLAGQDFAFKERTYFMIGRAEDCDIRLPADYESSDVSRHHCVFDIGPPSVLVRDLGSRNGTYVNDEKIGRRPLHQEPEEADLNDCPACELHDGDEIRVGKTIFRVGIKANSAAMEDSVSSAYSG